MFFLTSPRKRVVWILYVAASSPLKTLAHFIVHCIPQLVLSAGINSNQYGLDADGIDRHFGVNALGHFLAINVLYPLIRATSKLPNTLPPRIVFEASEMHRRVIFLAFLEM